METECWRAICTPSVQSCDALHATRRLHRERFGAVRVTFACRRWREVNSCGSLDCDTDVRSGRIGRVQVVPCASYAAHLGVHSFPPFTFARCCCCCCHCHHRHRRGVHPHSTMLDGCVRERESSSRESVLIYCAVLAFTTFYGRGGGMEEEKRRLVPVDVRVCACLCTVFYSGRWGERLISSHPLRGVVLSASLLLYAALLERV